MSHAPAVHPRETFTIDGAEAAEAQFQQAIDRGRLHHAWLLTGPEGVGKATFAYRAARRLLGARPAAAYGPLGSDPDDPVCRQIIGRAHPDLLVLEKAAEDGKPRKYIPVDEARRLPEFFSKAPASAPFRVAIIDAADDMNINAANALLKILEEPPARGVLFLVSHSPGGLIATVRSRCRRLAFAPWSETRIAGFIVQRLGMSLEDAAHLARMAKGAPGRALRLAESDGLKADAVARQILTALPQVDEAALLSVTDSFRGAEGQARFELLFERLADRVHDMAVSAAAEGPASRNLDAWVQAWESLVRLPQEADAVNLDRADVLFTAIGRLKAAARA